MDGAGVDRDRDAKFNLLPEVLLRHMLEATGAR